MNDWLYTAANATGVAATCIFALLLIWYLIRYFAGAEGMRSRIFSKATNKLHAPTTTLPKVLIWVLAPSLSHVG